MPLILVIACFTRVADSAASQYPVSEIDRPLTLPAHVFSARILTDVEVLPGSRAVGAATTVAAIASYGLGPVELGVAAIAPVTPTVSLGGASLILGVTVVRQLLALWLKLDLPVPWLPTSFYSWGVSLAVSLRHRLRPWMALRIFDDVVVFRRFDAYGVSPTGYPLMAVQLNLPVGIELQLTAQLVAAVRLSAVVLAYETNPSGDVHGFFPVVRAGFHLGYTALQNFDVVCSMTVQRYLVGPVPLTYVVGLGLVLRL